MTMKRISILLLLATVALALAVGCSRTRSDAQIIGEVVTKINADPKISEKQVSVMSSNGVVTLSGSAATEEERTQAANDAAQVEGVKTVVNNLLLDAPPSMQASALPPALNEKAEKPAAPAARASKKPSAYHERRQHSASARNAANDMPFISSGPSVNTPSTTAIAPMPTATAPVVPPPPPPPKPVTIESGTVLNIRMIDAVDTGKNHAGDSFRATLDSPITVGDKVVIPEGADVVGRIADLKDAGHFAGQPQLALELSSLSVNGRKYTLHTNQYTRQGKSRGSSTAKKVGAGAAIGAVIGGIAGGGKGAAIGAATGAGVGGGAQAVTKPEQVRVETEALLSFRLENPLTLMPVSNLQRPRGNSSGAYNAPPPPDNNDDDIIDYSDNSNSNSNSNRPVLKRRPQTGNDQSSANPPE